MKIKLLYFGTKLQRIWVIHTQQMYTILRSIVCVYVRLSHMILVQIKKIKNKVNLECGGTTYYIFIEPRRWGWMGWLADPGQLVETNNEQTSSFVYKILNNGIS